MNKKGFTLMELLLVVAILAIVAAAAAPTFTSGASDALKEARKSAFLAAYQNTVTGAHMMIALAASKGYDVASQVSGNSGSIELDNFTQITNGTGENAEVLVHQFDYYAPLATRQFKNSNGDIYSLGAKVIKSTTGNKLYITYNKSESTAVGGKDIKIGDTSGHDSSPYPRNQNRQWR